MQTFQAQFLNVVRERNPLIHNITNLVSANFTANGLLAIGASPMMAESPDEMAELAAISSAVVLNLGTPSDEKVAAMLAAGVAANRANVPVVLDPVAVGASQLRRNTVAKLANDISFTAIRGNAGELAYLAGLDWQAKGVDAGKGSGNLADIAKTVAQKFSCVAVLSGEQDFVSDGKQVARLSNGVALFPKVTASGCLLSAMVGAFVAVAPRELAFQAACEACMVYAVAGELAAQGLADSQTGAFAVRLLDSLAAINEEQVAQFANVDLDFLA
ncbi:hydroxyethylthiazole kinase [Kingella negevensis]|uniref:hydroxyethylthiazole kinase n=1 Tax=Kingella negevensis TaxID=1522312 RepID=UPI00254C2DF3|nr:hydroxyethylthiazole kinase [Kingella negevensis]MDK4684875.1 hydroxyethylthiazole kinase [Kingella negevensis]MDK4707765.1 hydroxyethylthiazole kinase [Kingella negevensis]MDK4709288.1 hydroxyethylthiazole kinase [Kingella negevensis]